jgi:two-component system CheB/CheR fusion protein
VAPRDRSKRSKAQGSGRSGAGVKNNKRSAGNENARPHASTVTEGAMPKVIVGLGASAGGIGALEKFFAVMPRESGGAFVVILHLDPTHDSSIAAILGRQTTMSVTEAVNGELVQRERVYIIPPNRVMRIERGRLRLSPPAEPRGWRVPIDHFLTSLGEDQRQRSIGILLSGTGSDGTIGLKAIKSAGGLTMAQDPETAEQAGMSRSAIAMGVVDRVLPVDEMPDHVIRYSSHAYTNDDAEPGHVLPPGQDADLGGVLAVLRTRVHMDFSSYRKGTIRRRMQRRMGIRHIEDVSEYLRVLRDDPVEVQQLAADMLIGVTGFFREREAWTKLEELVIKPMIASKTNDEPVRVWVPACATGEEAYGLTVLLFHHLEKAHKICPVQVFATDIDHAALEHARAGLFPESIAADVGPEYLQHYFVKEGDRYKVGKSVRDAVVFAAQNVIADAPYSKLDLISCRNLLIYLEPDTQRRLLSLFHFALLDGGYLFLGSSETIGAQTEQFTALSRKWRIYRRTGAVHLNHLDLNVRDGAFGVRRPALERSEPIGDRAVRHAEQAVLRRFAPACAVVDRQADIRYLFGPTERYLTQPTGPLTSNIFEWCKGSLRTRLRAALHRVWDQGEAVEIVELRGGREDETPFRATIERLKDPADLAGMILIAFHEPRAPMADEPDVVEQDGTVVQKLEDELKETREDLQTTIEELQTSNEEFKAVNEEALSINEELQSTNEELETSKEELQSLNEELLTVNFQLQTKLGELEQRNDDLDNLLRSTDLAAIFLDRNFCIKWFSPAMTALLSLIPSDVGRPLGDFAQRFTDPDLLRQAETVLRDLAPITREIRTHEGRWYLRRLLPYRTRADSINGIVITFTDIHALRQAEQELKDRNESLERAVDARTATLTVLQDVAGAANRATSVDEAVRMAIQLVCVHAGFDLGHAWRVDDTTHTVVPLDVWYVAPGRDYSDFVEVTMRTVLGPGDGVIRRTLARGEPQWIEDVRGQEFVRGAFEKFGIRSVATLPVMVEGRPIVVLEMFSSSSRGIPGSAFLPSLASVGIHIGHVIERQMLEKQVADQTDRERRSIGQELHDSVGQSLAGLAMMAGELKAQIEGGQDKPKLSAIDALHRGIEGAKSELRNVIRGMLPVEFDGNGLMNALLDLAETTEAMHSVKCRFVSDDPELVAIDEGFMGAQLYRIAQEAVRNAVTHGEATAIEIALRGRRRIELEVTDDGHGDWTHADTRGSGVRIMRYRADLIGGRIEVVAERGKGTRVICIVPRRPQAPVEPECRT